MGDLGNLYKLYFKVYTKINDEATDETNLFQDTEEIYGSEIYKIRNRNKDTYRYYDSNGNTQKIHRANIDGVFIENGMLEEVPFIACFIMTDDKDMNDLFTGVIFPKDEEEKKGLDNLKEYMRKYVEKAVEKLVLKIKNTMEKQIPEDKNENNKEDKTISETVS